MFELEKNETLIYTARKHWFVFVVETFVLFLAALAPLLLWNVIGGSFEEMVALIELAGSGTALGLFLYTFFLIILWMVFALLWTDYYLDVWYVTSERFIDVRQVGMFSREESSVSLDRVQDVTVKTSGFFPTVLGYGKLSIQTAGEMPFEIKNVANPEGLKDVMVDECAKARERSREVHLSEESLRNLKNN